MIVAKVRWIRLNVDFDDQPWLFVLSSDAQLAWVKLQCHMKRDGVRGTCNAMAPMVAARRWGVGEEHVVKMLQAAIKAEVLISTGESWSIVAWAEDQEDTTNADRQKRFRSKNKPVEPVTESNALRNDEPLTSVTDCRVTETPTETETVIPNSKSKTDSTLGAPKPRPEGGLDFWEEFWAAYPKRAGDRKKTPSKAKFLALIRTVPAELVIEGAKRYAAFCDAMAYTGTERVQQALTWLNNSAWTEEFEIPDSAPNRRNGTNGTQGTQGARGAPGSQGDSIEFRKTPLANLDYWIGRNADDEPAKFWMVDGERTKEPFSIEEWRRLRGLES